MGAINTLFEEDVGAQYVNSYSFGHIFTAEVGAAFLVTKTEPIAAIAISFVTMCIIITLHVLVVELYIAEQHNNRK